VFGFRKNGGRKWDMKGGIDFIPYLDIRYVKKIEGLGKGNEAFLSHQSIPKGGGGL